ncbi:MAG TPA: TlpA disulfide reductase family protein [Solirubrobacterales bacterium]|jgi:cytochrome c biogenesis protein CcmG/thiol:disulfide interchange protein DsbE
MSRRNLIYAIGAIFVLGAIAADLALDSGGSATAPGKPAPPLPREVLVGHRVTVSSLRGRPAAINFWASWCEPCRQEAPEFERLGRKLHGRASLVGVDWEDNRASALAFVHRYGWTFPSLRASADAAAERYGIVGLPTTFVLDRRGRIAEVLRGPQTAADLAQALGLSGGR